MKKAASIDLAKIKAKELPSGTVKADFGDGNGEQEFTVHAIGDIARRDIMDVLGDQREINRNSKLQLILLTEGLDCINGDKATARYLLENATEACLLVTAEIVRLTNEFYAKKGEEKETAEKN